MDLAEMYGSYLSLMIECGSGTSRRPAAAHLESAGRV